jgi:hypothetical protein
MSEENMNILKLYSTAHLTSNTQMKLNRAMVTFNLPDPMKQRVMNEIYNGANSTVNRLLTYMGAWNTANRMRRSYPKFLLAATLIAGWIVLEKVTCIKCGRPRVDELICRSCGLELKTSEDNLRERIEKIIEFGANRLESKITEV